MEGLDGLTGSWVLVMRFCQSYLCTGLGSKHSLEVYIVDQPSRGRSPWQQSVDGSQATFNSFVVEARFTATAHYGLWPNSTLHTQWPGNGTLGDETYNKFYTSIVPLLTNDTETATKVNNALVALLDTIQVKPTLTQIWSAF